MLSILKDELSFDYQQDYDEFDSSVVSMELWHESSVSKTS